MPRLPIQNKCSIIWGEIKDTLRSVFASNKPRMGKHIVDFPYMYGLVFILLVLVFVMSWFGGKWSWEISKYAVYLVVGITTVLFLWRPMNAVYGLMGTSGSIRLFFANFLLITLIFASIYQCAFFKYAGISYNVNQPHIDYDCYRDYSREIREVPDTNEIIIERIIDGVSVRECYKQIETLRYQPITFGQTWRNTIMTTLMQEPTELFSAATTYNAERNKKGDVYSDNSKATAFHWLLNIQVLISWIFFGVFISILYSKFRYES